MLERARSAHPAPADDENGGSLRSAARRVPAPGVAQSSRNPELRPAVTEHVEMPRFTPLHMLIVDDDVAVRRVCAEIAARLGFHAQVAASTTEVRAILHAQPIDLLLLDLKLPGSGGLSLLEEVRSRFPGVVVVVMTAFATVSSAVEAMRLGASDYLTKPFGMDQFADVLERASQRRATDRQARALREQLRVGAGMGPLIGRSPAMERLYRLVSKVALTQHPVLIVGESGTGKETVARQIHTLGPQGNRPFIPVDCGCLLPGLIESELFGHVKGAVPNAPRAKDGLLVAAGHGSVFLDEVGELPLDLQAKLLRALQEREVRPLGATYSLPITARVLAASEQDLGALVESGRFRKDLYFRLNVVNIPLPPLRERRTDIPLLAVAVMERACNDLGKQCTLADDALRMLQDYSWPGNVRELEQVVERAVALSSGPLLHRADFPAELQGFSPTDGGGSESAGMGHHTAGGHNIVSIAEMEKQAILNTIRQFKGDKVTAARLLGIGKTTLYRKLKEYGIDPGTLPEE